MSNITVNGVIFRKRVLVRSTRIQRTHLVNRLCADRSLITLPATSQQWHLLTKELNAMGPAKSANAWKMAWTDIKRKTARSIHDTGEFLNKEAGATNDYDRKVLSILASSGLGENNGTEQDEEDDDGDNSMSQSREEFDSEPQPIVYVGTDETPNEHDSLSTPDNGDYIQENFMIKPTPKFHTKHSKGEHLSPAATMRPSASAESSIKNLEELASRQVDIFDRFLSFIERTEEKRLQLEERSLNMQNRLLDITQEMVKVLANK